MPLLDSDIILGYLKDTDWLQDHAKRIFIDVIEAKLDGYLSTSLFIEVAFVLKREGKSDGFQKVVDTLYGIPNLFVVPLTETIFQKSSELIQQGLGVLDSIQAATALSQDKMIISTDHIYDKVTGLKKIDPRDY